MKVLIADDERHIRIGISKSIDWEKIGISEVLMAEDGIMAVELCRRKRPEIIITDIRMPGIDGLELARRASEQYGAKKVIVLSGYSEFDYAREAIRIGVEEYLVKPVDIDDLTRLLQKSIEQIQMEQKRGQEEKQQEIRELLECEMDGYLPDAQRIHSLICLGRNHMPAEICVVIVSKDRVYGMDIQEIEIKWDRYLDDNEQLLWEQTDGMVFVEMIDLREQREQYQMKLRVLACRIMQECGEKVYVSVAVSRRGYYLELRELYQQARIALTHRMYQGCGSCLLYENLEKKTVSIYPTLFLDRAEVRSSVIHLQMDDLRAQIARQFEYLRGKKCTNPTVALELCLSIKTAVFDAMKEKDIDIEGILNNNETLFQSELFFSNLDSYEAWITDYCFLLLQGLKDLQGKTYSTMLAHAVDYIQRHYMEDISQTVLAEEVKKSSSYFSSVFKREMGVSFNEYLNTIRIRKARELLEKPDARIYEVAEAVGYHDYKYFTTVFKKFTGCPPREYANGVRRLKGSHDR